MLSVVFELANFVLAITSGSWKITFVALLLLIPAEEFRDTLSEELSTECCGFCCCDECGGGGDCEDNEDW